MAKLTALKVARDLPVGMHGDGDGLYLRVKSAGKGWIFRYRFAGRRRDMGLGVSPAVSLADARRRAADARRMIAARIDPIGAARAAAKVAGGIPTFREAAERYIAAHEDGWRNPKHRQQWKNTLATYAFPRIGTLSVADVAVGDVMRVLEPVWKTTPETASRLRGRIEAVIDWAIARDYRSGDNPARWRGRLQQLLPARSKVQRVQHHAALPWREAPAFLAALRKQPGTASRALEFAILTAARNGEARGATWGEMDLANAGWNVPASRMKAGRDHRVPLSPAALALLDRMLADHRAQHGAKAKPAAEAYVFPGQGPGRPLSENTVMALLRRIGRDDITVHGFRSTFRDWAAEATSYPREVAEAALAHANPDKVESAYLRSDHLEKRRRIMADWAKYCR
ncbi:MAG: site-specific integrase [Alphaproteobacteria bacterium]|nr:site-specific integrase [Alphaproteobacteria bacterium]